MKNLNLNILTFVDTCRTLDILKQDSGLLPKPTENWNTFTPEEGMLAWVFENNNARNKSIYQFKSNEWVKLNMFEVAELIEIEQEKKYAEMLQMLNPVEEK